MMALRAGTTWLTMLLVISSCRLSPGSGSLTTANSTAPVPAPATTGSANSNGQTGEALSVTDTQQIIVDGSAAPQFAMQQANLVNTDPASPNYNFELGCSVPLATVDGQPSCAGIKLADLKAVVTAAPSGPLTLSLLQSLLDGSEAKPVTAMANFTLLPASSALPNGGFSFEVSAASLAANAGTPALALSQQVAQTALVAMTSTGSVQYFLMKDSAAAATSAKTPTTATPPAVPASAPASAPSLATTSTPQVAPVAALSAPAPQPAPVTQQVPTQTATAPAPALLPPQAFGNSGIPPAVTGLTTATGEYQAGDVVIFNAAGGALSAVLFDQPNHWVEINNGEMVSVQNNGSSTPWPLNSALGYIANQGPSWLVAINGSSVTLEGSFHTVLVGPAAVQLNLSEAVIPLTAVASLNALSSANALNVTVAAQVTVNTAVLNAPAVAVAGNGKITTLIVTAAGANVNVPVAATSIGLGLTAMVNGQAAGGPVPPSGTPAQIIFNVVQTPPQGDSWNDGWDYTVRLLANVADANGNYLNSEMVTFSTTAGALATPFGMTAYEAPADWNAFFQPGMLTPASASPFALATTTIAQPLNSFDTTATITAKVVGTNVQASQTFMFPGTGCGGFSQLQIQPQLDAANGSHQALISGSLLKPDGTTAAGSVCFTSAAQGVSFAASCRPVESDGSFSVALSSTTSQTATVMMTSNGANLSCASSTRGFSSKGTYASGGASAHLAVTFPVPPVGRGWPSAAALRAQGQTLTAIAQLDLSQGLTTAETVYDLAQADVPVSQAIAVVQAASNYVADPSGSGGSAICSEPGGGRDSFPLGRLPLDDCKTYLSLTWTAPRPGADVSTAQQLAAFYVAHPLSQWSDGTPMAKWDADLMTPLAAALALWGCPNQTAYSSYCATAADAAATSPAMLAAEKPAIAALIAGGFTPTQAAAAVQMVSQDWFGLSPLALMAKAGTLTAAQIVPLMQSTGAQALPVASILSADYNLGTADLIAALGGTFTTQQISTALIALTPVPEANEIFAASSAMQTCTTPACTADQLVAQGYTLAQAAEALRLAYRDPSSSATAITAAETLAAMVQNIQGAAQVPPTTQAAWSYAAGNLAPVQAVADTYAVNIQDYTALLKVYGSLIGDTSTYGVYKLVSARFPSATPLVILQTLAANYAVNVISPVSYASFPANFFAGSGLAVQDLRTLGLAAADSVGIMVELMGYTMPCESSLCYLNASISNVGNNIINFFNSFAPAGAPTVAQNTPATGAQIVPALGQAGYSKTEVGRGLYAFLYCQHWTEGPKAFNECYQDLPARSAVLAANLSSSAFAGTLSGHYGYSELDMFLIYDDIANHWTGWPDTQDWSLFSALAEHGISLPAIALYLRVANFEVEEITLYMAYHASVGTTFEPGQVASAPAGTTPESPTVVANALIGAGYSYSAIVTALESSRLYTDSQLLSALNSLNVSITDSGFIAILDRSIAAVIPQMLQLAQNINAGTSQPSDRYKVSQAADYISFYSNYMAQAAYSAGIAMTRQRLPQLSDADLAADVNADGAEPLMPINLSPADTLSAYQNRAGYIVQAGVNLPQTYYQLTINPTPYPAGKAAYLSTLTSVGSVASLVDNLPYASLQGAAANLWTDNVAGAAGGTPLPPGYVTPWVDGFAASAWFLAQSAGYLGKTAPDPNVAPADLMTLVSATAATALDVIALGEQLQGLSIATASSNPFVFDLAVSGNDARLVLALTTLRLNSGTDGYLSPNDAASYLKGVLPPDTSAAAIGGQILSAIGLSSVSDFFNLPSMFQYKKTAYFMSQAGYGQAETMGALEAEFGIEIASQEFIDTAGAFTVGLYDEEGSVINVVLLAKGLLATDFGAPALYNTVAAKTNNPYLALSLTVGEIGATAFMAEAAPPNEYSTVAGGLTNEWFVLSNATPNSCGDGLTKSCSASP